MLVHRVTVSILAPVYSPLLGANAGCLFSGGASASIVTWVAGQTNGHSINSRWDVLASVCFCGLVKFSFL